MSEGGAGRIIRIDLDGGNRQPIIDGTQGLGKLYFSQGSMTNTGIVGLDSYEMGWLRRLPHAHDIPGLDVVLTGIQSSLRGRQVYSDPAGLACGLSRRTSAVRPWRLNGLVMKASPPASMAASST